MQRAAVAKMAVAMSQRRGRGAAGPALGESVAGSDWGEAWAARLGCWVSEPPVGAETGTSMTPEDAGWLGSAGKGTQSNLRSKELLDFRLVLIGRGDQRRREGLFFLDSLLIDGGDGGLDGAVTHLDRILEHQGLDVTLVEGGVEFSRG